MTVVNPKSISGITSITTASGADNLLTIHTNNGTERLRVDSTGTTKIVTGIVTTLTATSSAKVGSGVTLSPDGDVFATGVTTATTFSGSGASLTNLPAANITGTLPAISGANLTNLDASDLASGTVPTARLGSGTASSSTFLRGDSTFATVTVPGGANALNFNDDIKTTYGTGNDFEIWHSSNSNSYIKNSTGELKLASDNIALMTTDQSEKFIDCNGNGAVELYYDNTEVFSTQSNGIKLHNGGASYLYFYDVNTSTIAMYTNSVNLRWYDDVNNDNIMQLSQNGNLNIDGNYGSGGVDYAEYFESTDGTVIPVGTTVVLDNGKVRAATDSETPIGVIRPKTSGTSVTGGVNQTNWQGKYLVDDYDGRLMESAVHCTWTDSNGDNQQCWKDRPPTGVTIPSDAVETTRDRPKLNPLFDESKTYVPRSERDEWNCVGLLGQIPITKGQPTSANWIKMKDRSATVELWMVK